MPRSVSTTRGPTRRGSGSGRSNHNPALDDDNDDDDDNDPEEEKSMAEGGGEKEVTSTQQQRRSKRHQQQQQQPRPSTISGTRPVRTTTASPIPPPPLPPKEPADAEEAVARTANEKEPNPAPSRKRSRRRLRDDDNNDDDNNIQQLVARRKRSRREDDDNNDEDEDDDDDNVPIHQLVARHKRKKRRHHQPVEEVDEEEEDDDKDDSKSEQQRRRSAIRRSSVQLVSTTGAATSTGRTTSPETATNSDNNDNDDDDDDDPQPQSLVGIDTMASSRSTPSVDEMIDSQAAASTKRQGRPRSRTSTIRPGSTTTLTRPRRATTPTAAAASGDTNNEELRQDEPLEENMGVDSIPSLSTTEPMTHSNSNNNNNNNTATNSDRPPPLDSAGAAEPHNDKAAIPTMTAIENSRPTAPRDDNDLVLLPQPLPGDADSDSSNNNNATVVVAGVAVDAVGSEPVELVRTKPVDNNNHNNNQEASEMATHPDQSGKHHDSMPENKMDSVVDNNRPGVVLASAESNKGHVGQGGTCRADSDGHEEDVFHDAVQAAVSHPEEDPRKGEPASRATSPMEQTAAAALSVGTAQETEPLSASNNADLALSKSASVDSAAKVNENVKDDSAAVLPGPPGAAKSLDSATIIVSGVCDVNEEHSTSLKQDDTPINDMLTRKDGPMEPVFMKQPQPSSEKAAAQITSTTSSILVVMPKEGINEFVSRDLAEKDSNNSDPIDIERMTMDAALRKPQDDVHKNDAASRMDAVDSNNCNAAPSAAPMDEEISEHAADLPSPQFAIENVSCEPASSNLHSSSAESKVAPQDRVHEVSAKCEPVVATTKQNLSGLVGKQAQGTIVALGVKSDSVHTSQALHGVGGMVPPSQSKACASVLEELAQGRTSFELSQILAQSTLSSEQPKEMMVEESCDSTEICMRVAVGATPAHIYKSTDNMVANKYSDLDKEGKVANKVKAEAPVHSNVTKLVGVESVSVQVAAETERKPKSIAITEAAAVKPADTPEAMHIQEALPAVENTENDDGIKTPGSELLPESVKILLDSSAMTATGSRVNNEDRLGNAPDIQSMGNVGAEVPTQTSDQTSSALCEKEDLVEVENLRIPMLWPDHEKPAQETRVSLERIKVMIYSVGSRVHASAGYEQMFVAYWKALAVRIGGRLSEAEDRKCQRVVNKYLKTKLMRKLHNKLILVLLGRCMQPTAPLRDISGFMPERLRNKMCIVPKPSSKSQVEKRKRLTTVPGIYKPVVKEKVLSSAYTHELALSPASSLRIPGALVIDPRVRQIADAAGMKTSENAIWLLVVALKEFTATVLVDTLSTMKAVETGLIPRQPSIRPRFLPKKALKSDIVVAIKKPAEDRKPATKCITPLDIHLTTMGIPSGSKSLGGCFSRTTLEQSLVSCFDSSIVVGGNAFQDVRNFFVSAVSSCESAQLKTKAETAVPHQLLRSTSESNANDKRLKESLSNKGHGHGAKDLASLKARSSISKASPGVESVSALAMNVAGSAGSTEEFITESQQQQQLPHQHHNDDDQQHHNDVDQQQRTQNDLERDKASGCSGENQNVAIPRKGKGFGVKNLAAMRARSITTLTEGADEAAKAASVADENIESSVKSVVPVRAAPASIPAPTAGTHRLSPLPSLATKDASPRTGDSVEAGGLQDKPSFPQSLPAASIQGQHHEQTTGIKHDVSVPYVSQNAQMAPQSMQNPAFALANAQLAQGLANVLIHNAGHASGQRPAMVPYPAQPPQGISLGQLAQMVPGLHQGRHFSQFPHTSAAQLQHQQQHMTSSQSAQSIQAMAYAKAFAQNMANVTVANHGTKNPNTASTQAHPALVAPVTAASEQSPTAQSPAGAGIEPTKPPSSLETDAPAQQASADSTAESTKVESNESSK